MEVGEIWKFSMKKRKRYLHDSLLLYIKFRGKQKNNDPGRTCMEDFGLGSNGGLNDISSNSSSSPFSNNGTAESG